MESTKLLPVFRLTVVTGTFTVTSIYLFAFLSELTPPWFPFNGYNGARWGALLLLATIAAFSRTIPQKRALGFTATFIATGLASTALSPYPAEASAVFGTHLGLLLLAWSCARAADQGGVNLLRGWCCVALAAALIYSAIVITGIVTLTSLGHLNPQLLFLGFAHPRFFLQLTTLWLPCIIALALDPSHVRRLRMLAAVGALLWAMLIWLNGGSGAFYALILGAGASALLLGWRRIVPWAAAIAACMGLAWLLVDLASVWLPLSHTLHASSTLGLSGRPALWERAMAAIVQRPFLGWGPGAYAHFTDVLNGHPHNMFLAWAVSYGLIGLALVGWLFWRAFDPLGMRARLQTLPQNKQRYAAAMTIAALSGLAHANVSGLTIMPMAQILLVTTLGLWAGLLGHIAPIAPARPWHRPLHVLLAGAILITAAWSMTHNCALQPHEPGDCAYTPAFWFAYPTSGGIEVD